jgi:Xaa-Pro aminopeptidase
MPHGVASDRVIKKGELVVVDLGASVDGYCSDITRTFATGKPSRLLTNVYQVVKKAQALAVAAVKPGADCAVLDKIARGHIATAGYEKEFGHSLGHGVGLEPHEGPLLAAQSKEKLQAGMTVTVEPGIYLDGVGGVRIEDTVLVGKRGPVPLTMFPRKLKVLR